MIIAPLAITIFFPIYNHHELKQVRHCSLAKIKQEGLCLRKRLVMYPNKYLGRISASKLKRTIKESPEAP